MNQFEGPTRSIWHQFQCNPNASWTAKRLQLIYPRYDASLYLQCDSCRKMQTFHLLSSFTYTPAMLMTIVYTHHSIEDLQWSGVEAISTPGRGPQVLMNVLFNVWTWKTGQRSARWSLLAVLLSLGFFAILRKGSMSNKHDFDWLCLNSETLIKIRIGHLRYPFLPLYTGKSVNIDQMPTAFRAHLRQ